MQIGLNFTLGETLPMVQRLVAQKRIDYVELLVDNFIHLPPDHVAEAFSGIPVGFHIMFSKYIENDDASLDSIARRLRALIDVMKPIYVSDHIAQFTHKGRTLYHLAEIDYVGDYDRVRGGVDRWQQRLGQKLYLENYPSILDGGYEAPAFWHRLMRDTGCGILFDASNAVCSYLNCGLPLAAWEGIIDSTPHFHIAGYATSFIAPHLILDTHDRLMSEDTLAFVADYRERFDKPGATMTYERDDNIEEDDIVIDIDRLHAIFAGKPVAAVLQGEAA